MVELRLTELGSNCSLLAARQNDGGRGEGADKRQNAGTRRVDLRRPVDISTVFSDLSGLDQNETRVLYDRSFELGSRRSRQFASSTAK